MCDYSAFHLNGKVNNPNVCMYAEKTNLQNSTMMLDKAGPNHSPKMLVLEYRTHIE